MAYKVSVVSLGCPKNQVDAEMMLASLLSAGFELSVVEAEADAIIINTCGFIDSAKEESINTLIEMGQYKDDKCELLVAAGCLAAVLIYGFGFEVLFAWIAFFFISRYNGERGRKLGLMPYVFYPVHLLAVWLVSIIIV